MTLFNAWGLLWLLPLVPVIILFYLLKLKRKEVVVSSVLLWSHLVKDVQANAPFQKLRRNLLLLLQLLIAILAILAFSQPAYYTRALGGNHTVVILDGSASMKSKDGQGGSRFEEARRLALRMVADMHGGDRMMVLLATGRTHRLTNFSSDANELRAAINASKPQDTDTHLRDAVLLAASAAATGAMDANNRIYVLSDGAFPPMSDIDPRGSEVRFVKVGSRSNNVGIVAMDVRRSFKDGGKYQMFVAVRNYAPEPRATNIEFYRNGNLVDARELKLPAASQADGFSERAEILENLTEVNGILEARLDLKDDLDSDNIAYSQISARRDLQVLLVTDGNLYLQRALNLDPNVRLSVTTPDAYIGQPDFDVVVFENVGPKKVGPGNHLYINCGGPTAPVQVIGKIQNAGIVDWERGHPVMRYVRLSAMQMLEALKVTDRPWAVRLAEHETGTAIAVGEHAGVKSAFVGFPLLKTEFPLRVAFPIFFNNMVQWLGARPGKTEGMQLRTGQPASFDIPEGVKEVTVKAPDGSRASARVDGRTATYSDTEQLGVYEASGANLNARFATNLLSRDESNIRPQDRIQFGNRPVLAGTGSVWAWRELWRPVLLAALLILAIEWWVYHRRL